MKSFFSLKYEIFSVILESAGVEVSTVAETFNLDPAVVEEVNRVQVRFFLTKFGVWSQNRNWSEDFECTWFGSWQFLVSADFLSQGQINLGKQSSETNEDFDPWLDLSCWMPSIPSISSHQTGKPHRPRSTVGLAGMRPVVIVDKKTWSFSWCKRYWCT